MSHGTGKDAPVAERLEALILEYVEARHAGAEVDRERLLRAHPEFRQELEAFFASHDRVERLAAPLRGLSAARPDAKSRIVNPSSASAQPAGAAAAELGQLGEFRLLREVGRGGMGVVYEAEQLSLRRRVALKVLPFAAAIDERRLQRFKNEAMAAAHLRHASIVPVHAVGADLGVHYYAMQFIDGQSLAALIAELRRLTGTAERPPVAETARTSFTAGAAGAPEAQAAPESSLAVVSASRELSAGSRRYFNWVADLGRQAAEAMEHAHQMGIVHRDIKPANLLLDARGQLWITDFGLAQVGGDAGLTMTGEMLGTLRYASPEQTRARTGMVDHRTDIYSLGATLYELLTLRPLFEGRDRHELLHQIANEEPRLPRAIRASVPGELETVVLKALAKDPAERYATAQEMAADLQRFLENRPILARRPTPAERLRKWSRRHPSVVVACAALLLLLAAGSLVSAVLIHGEQRKAEEAYNRERQRADEAEAQFRLARRSVDELFRLSEVELAHNPGAQALRRRLLTSVLSYYQEFIDRRRDDPWAQEDLLETSKRAEKILADLAVLRAAGQLNLLSQSPVLDDLRLDERQRVKVGELSARVAKQWKDSFHDIGRVSAAERERRHLEQARTNEAELKAVLTAEQLQRLHQVRLQADVPAAFREPELAAVLRLTDAQRDRIHSIEEEGFVEMLRTFRPDLMSAVPTTSAGTKDRPSMNERILTVLTEEQLRSWRQVTGVPFKGPVRIPSPFELLSPASESKAPEH